MFNKETLISLNAHQYKLALNEHCLEKKIIESIKYFLQEVYEEFFCWQEENFDLIDEN